MIVKTTFDNEKDNSNSSKAVTAYLNNNIGIRRSLIENTRSSLVTDIYADRISVVPIVRGKNVFKKIIMCFPYNLTTQRWQQTMYFYLKFKENADELEWIYYSRNYINAGYVYTVHPYWRYVVSDVWIMVKPDPTYSSTDLKVFFGDNISTTYNTHVFTAIPEL